MNIFYTDTDYKKAAEFLRHDNKRRGKMILESVQMLSTAINVAVGHQQAPYKTTHVNHPCNIWLRQSKLHFLWLLNYTKELYKVNLEVTGKQHKSGMLIFELYKFVNLFEDNGFTEPPNCAKSKAKNLDFTHLPINQAYTEYLQYQWGL